MSDGPCDDIECYVRWQEWNTDRDMYLERAFVAEEHARKLSARVRRLSAALREAMEALNFSPFVGMSAEELAVHLDRESDTARRNALKAAWVKANAS